MSTLYMFRHGQASFGQENYDQLSSTGYRQARIVAKHLRAVGMSFDAVYTGEMDRQKQTFRTMADVFTDAGRVLPSPVAMADLNEYDSEGVWQKFLPLMARENPDLDLDETDLVKNPKAFQRIFARLVHLWINGAYGLPDVESWTMFRTRIAKALKTIMQQEGSGKDVMVFSSAGPIAVAVQLATGMPDDRCIGISWQVMNASLTRFRYNLREMTLVGFNDVAALEIQGDPTLLTYR
jgi:broad specificity phosphatase PhoE